MTSRHAAEPSVPTEEPLVTPQVQRFDLDVGLYDEHPHWCKCQRVCGGDQ